MTVTMLDMTTSMEDFAEVFRAAMMEAEVKDQDHLVLVDPVLGSATVALDQRNDLLCLRSAWRIKGEASREQRLAFANRINDRYILVRACIDEDDDLILDCQLPLTGGQPARTVVQLVRLFLHIDRIAVREQDTEDIVG